MNLPIVQTYSERYYAMEFENGYLIYMFIRSIDRNNRCDMTVAQDYDFIIVTMSIMLAAHCITTRSDYTCVYHDINMRDIIILTF